MVKDVTPEEDYADLELSLSKLLATGVTLSAIITAIGILWFLITRHSGYPASALDMSAVHPESVPHTFAQLMAGLRSGKPFAIVALGLLLLILTPVFRVATSILLFFQYRDYLYTVVCAFVLAMLLIGMAYGVG